jgi:hypothetical protein
LGLFKFSKAFKKGFKINLTYRKMTVKIPNIYFERTPLETKQNNLFLNSICEIQLVLYSVVNGNKS